MVGPARGGDPGDYDLALVHLTTKYMFRILRKLGYLEIYLQNILSIYKPIGEKDNQYFCKLLEIYIFILFTTLPLDFSLRQVLKSNRNMI